MVARTISSPANDPPNGGIPTPPAGVALVIRAANDPSFSLADLARLIEREPSLTVNLLRWGNSAAYGSGREIRSVGQAAVMLGARTLRNLAVAHVVTTMRTKIDTGAFDAKLFWEDSLRRACAALVLARTAGYEDPSEALTVGLIQDLGLLVTVTSHRDQQRPTAGGARRPGDRADPHRGRHLRALALGALRRPGALLGPAPRPGRRGLLSPQRHAGHGRSSHHAARAAGARRHLVADVAQTSAVRRHDHARALGADAPREPQAAGARCDRRCRHQGDGGPVGGARDQHQRAAELRVAHAARQRCARADQLLVRKN